MSTPGPRTYERPEIVNEGQGRTDDECSTSFKSSASAARDYPVAQGSSARLPEAIVSAQPRTFRS